MQKWYISIDGIMCFLTCTVAPQPTGIDPRSSRGHESRLPMWCVLPMWWWNLPSERVAWIFKSRGHRPWREMFDELRCLKKTSCTIAAQSTGVQEPLPPKIGVNVCCSKDILISDPPSIRDKPLPPCIVGS